jgi:colanic acid/amylovoran biosynthesis glycosyltransferase
MSSKKTVLIFRSKILGISETFILNHYNSLHNYKPILVGWQREKKGLDLSSIDSIVISTALSMSKPRLFFNKYIKPDKEVIELIRRIKPSIVHAHFGPDGVQISQICKQLGIPFVVTLHGYDATTTTKKLLFSRNIYLLNYFLKRKFLAKDAARTLPVSKYIEKMATKNGFANANMTVHYLGGKMIKRAPLLTPSCRKGILFVGRLVEKKGLNFLLNALALIKGKINDIELTVIGDGPLRKEYEQQAKELNVRVTFLGEQHNEEVMKMLGKARIFCMPSTRAQSGDNEGLPTVFIESLSLGTPIVTFKQGPLPEIVIEGKGGYLAEDRNIESLAEKLIESLTDLDLWIKNAEVGFEMVNKCFDITNQATILQSIYDDVIMQHSRA